MKLLLYCTKAKPYLEFKQIPRTLMEIDNSFDGYRCSWERTEDEPDFQINGKIVAECDFEVEKIYYSPMFCNYTTWSLGKDELLNKSCLTHDELKNYLGTKDVIGNNGYNGYAIHIKNLHIFDEPKKITAYHCKTNKNDELCLNGGCGYKFFHKAPKNMMKVYDHWGKGNEYVLISISPQEMCRIANKEQTILVRKKVLKEMLKNE